MLNRTLIHRFALLALLLSLGGRLAGAPLPTALAQEPPVAPTDPTAFTRDDMAGLHLPLQELPHAGPAAPFEPPAAAGAEIFASEADSAAPAPDAMSLLTCCRHFMPTIAQNASPGVRAVAPLPRILDGSFDLGGAAWRQLLISPCEPAERDFLLWVPATTLGANLDNDPDNGISLPAETTRPNVVWMGGGGGTKCDIDPAGLAVTHRLIQRLTLPADYAVRVHFDALVQSVESSCGHDVALVLANGVALPLSLPLCTAAEIQQWTERTVDLGAFRGQSVELEFRVSANSTLNSNLWLDNVETCGVDARLPRADQCPTDGWFEPSANSAGAGGISNTAGNSYDTTIAVSPIGRTMVAWADQSNPNSPLHRGEIYVRRWNGVMWETVGAGSASGGGISNTPNGESAEPALAIAGAALPHLPAERAAMAWVAWQDNADGDTEIYVRRWFGEAWVEAGAGSASGGGISNNYLSSVRPAIAIDSALLPVVAWTDVPLPGCPAGPGAATEIYVRRFDGVSWVDVGAGSATCGGVSQTPGASDNAALAVAPDGTLYLAWSDAGSGENEIYVRRWTGSAWVAVGSGVASSSGANDGHSAFTPALAAGPDNLPVVAWVDRSASDTEIFVRKFNGSTWEPLGASAGGGGVSNNDGASGEPSLVIGPNNLPVVAWSDLSGFNAEIYVRRWNGSSWAPLGSPGSAVLGGISNTPGYSLGPVLGVGRDGRLSVAWSDDSPGAGKGEIYVRRY